MGVYGHTLVIALVSSVKSEASSLAENEVGEEVFEAKEREKVYRILIYVCGERRDKRRIVGLMSITIVLVLRVRSLSRIHSYLPLMSQS